MKRINFITLGIKFAIFSVLLAVSPTYGFTSYFLSASGSDSNNGTSSSTPWQTISKLNASTFASGDAIYFRSGDTFSGQITVNQSGLTYDSYGSGAKPVLSGGVLLTGWTVYSGSIYKTKAPAAVKNLFSNSQQMTLARYPNTGFLAIGSTNGSSSVTASGVDQGFNWAGGNIRVRTVLYEYETHQVASSSGNTVTLTGSPSYPYTSGYGFYLDNKLEALDAPGEWYYNPSDMSVYFYAPGGVNPNTLTVVGSVSDYGIAGTQSNTTIQHLSFQFQAAAAVHFSDAASNVNILSNDVFGQWVNGIEFVGSGHTNCTIDGNRIQNVNGRGINTLSPHYFTITNNTVKSIGLIHGYGISQWQGMTAILSQAGSHNTIRGNVIDSVGYCGIRHDGSYNLIENNVISHTMLKLADGGAIYAYGEDGNTYGTTIRNNIIDGVGADGTGLPASIVAYAIYFDYGCFNMVVEGNTVIHSASTGVFIQYNDYGITLLDNIFYECTMGSEWGAPLSLAQHATLNHGQNVFKKNIFFPTKTVQPTVRIVDDQSWSAMGSVGTIDSNYYFNPYNHPTPFIIDSDPTGEYLHLSFAQWKSTTGNDAHSVEFAGSIADSLFVNRSSSPLTVSVTPGRYKDVDGASVTGSFTLQPYQSRLLIEKRASRNGKISLRSE